MYGGVPVCLLLFDINSYKYTSFIYHTSCVFDYPPTYLLVAVFIMKGKCHFSQKFRYLLPSLPAAYCSSFWIRQFHTNNYSLVNHYSFVEGECAWKLQKTNESNIVTQHTCVKKLLTNSAYWLFWYMEYKCVRAERSTSKENSIQL